MAILLTIIAFGLIIFIHELGHYLAAIRVGVRVEKFYLGFDFWGLKLFKFHYKGTEYGIGIFPMGGYVKLAGQEDFGKANVQGKEDEFTSKNFSEKAQILVGGVFFNFLSAFLFCVLAFYCGYRLISPEIGMINHGSAAWKYGFKEGDIITSVNGLPVSSFSDLQTEIMLSNLGDLINIKYLRNGQSFSKEIYLDKHPETALPSFGVEPASSLKILGVRPDTEAFKAGLQPGDMMHSIDGIKIEKWEDISLMLKKVAATKEKTQIEYQRNGVIHQAEVALKEYPRGLLGIRPELNMEIKSVLSGSQSEAIGIRAKMVFLNVNGNSDLQNEISTSTKKRHKILLKDGEQKVEFDYSGSLKDFENEISFIGVSFPVVLSEVIQGSSAEEIGLKRGDQIREIQIGHEKVQNPKWDDILQSVTFNHNKKIQIKVLRQKETLELSGQIGRSPEKHYLLGIVRAPKSIEELSVSTVLLWPFHMLRVTYKSMWLLVSGSISPKHMSGPVGIVNTTYKVASHGLSYLFYLMALISINLAFLNILPVPLLDGGHLLFCTIEAIKGTPVQEKTMQRFQYIGMIALFSLFAFVTWNDLNNIFL